MSWEKTANSVSQIARALSVIGDCWTLLIMREIAIGTRRFDEIQAQTGMSSSLLTARLERLQEHGIIQRVLRCDHPRHYEYCATRKGKELDAVLLSIRAWGMRWGGPTANGEPSIAMVHRASGDKIVPGWQPPQSDNPFTFDEVEIKLSSEFIDERNTKAVAFQKRKLKRT